MAVDDDGDDGSSCFFPCFSLSLYFPSLLRLGFCLFFLSSPYSALSSSVFIGKKHGERGLLSMSSHGIGVGWQGWLLCNRPKGTSHLFPHRGRPQVRA